MDTKTVYTFDADTKLYSGIKTLDYTDQDPHGNWNMPWNCTELEPPKAKEGFNIIWSGSAWEYQEIPKEPELEPPTLEELKANKVTQLGIAFAERRDGIRWVCGYGFDCATEDITNFLASYMPLLIAGSGTALYKVWITSTSKGIVEFTLEQLSTVYNTVRSSQLADYAWYESIKGAVLSCNTESELEQIQL